MTRKNIWCMLDIGNLRSRSRGAMSGFGKHLHELLEEHPEAALEHAKLFAELPLPTQLAIMRRRRKLSQRVLAKKLKVLQPHVARTESTHRDPRISSIVRAANAVRCHVSA
jgi:DNA-binding transcriptional regulator YiaG